MVTFCIFTILRTLWVHIIKNVLMKTLWLKEKKASQLTQFYMPACLWCNKQTIITFKFKQRIWPFKSISSFNKKKQK